MDVLNLRGVLTLDKSQYDEGLADADTGAHSFGGRFSKAMKVGAAAAAALGAATIFTGKKIVDGARQVAEYGDHVDKMSQKIGISADAYQKWDYVMQRAGGNVDQLKMGMKTLSQQAEKNSDAFQELGISQEEVASMSKEDLFEATVKGLSDMEDSTKRTALASKLLGRAGADMAPLFNQGSDAIEEQMDIAEKYGMVMPESAVKASAAFQDSMTTLQMTSQGLKNRMLGEFLPAMTKVTDGLALMFTGDMSGLDDVIKGVKQFIGKIGQLAPKLLEAGGKLLLELGKGLIQKIPSLLETAGQLISSLLEGLQTAMDGSASMIAKIVESIALFITENAPQMIQTALVIVTALAQGLIQAIPTIVASIPSLIRAIVNAIKSFAWDSTGKSIIQGLAKGLKAVGSLLKSAVTQPIAAVKKAFTNGFNSAKQKVVNIVNSLKNSVKEKVNAIKDAVGTAFKAAKQKAVDWMNKLKKGVKDKIDAAKQAVKKVVDKIKGFFPVSVGKIFTGWIPKISLKTNKSGDSASTSSTVTHSRFAKAMNQPYMFTKPTIFNQDIAGEAGDEMLYGRKSLMNDITEAMQKGGGKTVNITNHITVSGAEDPEAYMQRFIRSMEIQMRTA